MKLHMIKTFLRNIFISIVLATTIASSFMALPASAAVSDWQQGASIYPRTTTDLASAAGKASIDQLAASGANYATFIIPYYQSTIYSHDLQPGYDTPSDATLKAAIAYAKSKGLRVMLKPHLEPKTGQWRAHIKPTNRSAWYQAYGTMLVRYAKIAQSSGAWRICIGSELVNVSSSRVNPDNTVRWQTIIKQVRSVYTGRLTYSAQRPGTMGELETIRFWSQLDYIGVSGYFPMNVEGDVTITKLKARWAYWEQNAIRPVQQRYGKPVIFTEIGYRSLSGSHNDPWNYNRTGTVSEADQARAYRAFFSFWNNISYMRGVHLWDWEPNPYAGGPSSTTYTPQNKAAYNVLVQWWGGTGGYVPPTNLEKIEVWWPTQDTTISGVNAFQARVPSRTIDQYTMYWRVDGGTLNLMSDSQEGYPHKRSYVDVSSWNWSGTGYYTVEFVAYDKANAKMATQAVRIKVN